MNLELFKALLSMDSYNRGYEAGIKFGTQSGNNSDDFAGIKIGNAEIYLNSGVFIESSSRLDDDIGFYGIAYNIKASDGSVVDTVISYRGTDNPNPIPYIGDPWYGWGLGGGNTDSSHGQDI